ncbi:ABC transporter ATP-binding protein [bacterium]|nr:ABC transporter ATP-binding protein [bacterium]
MFLEINNLIVHYEKNEAIRDVSLNMEFGDIIAIIGSNGAGKSTILRTISGLNKPTSGEISFDGRRIDGLSPKNVVNLGVAHVLEERRLFPYMTVRENLNMGAYRRKDKIKIKDDLDKIYDYFPIIKDRTNQLAGTLSGGEQQMVALARALMSGPRLMLLDEPSLGLAPLVVKTVAQIIKKINSEQVGIVLVEQNARMALSISNRAYVLETGQITMSGNSKDLLNDENVNKAYLGG